MNRTTDRLISRLCSFALAAGVTLSLLAVVDSLALHERAVAEMTASAGASQTASLNDADAPRS